jgi:hypothetical protein
MLLSFSGKSQVMVKYSPDFYFQEGIYLLFDDFKQNSPTIPKKHLYIASGQVVTEVFERRQDMFTKNLKQQLEKVENFWGYSRSGKPYVGMSKILILGELMYYIAQEPNYKFDPNTQTNVASGTVAVKYLMDLLTGESYPFTLENFESLIKRDHVVYDEFMTIKKKKREKKMVNFLKKYNDRNPVFFPGN